jgi:SAM-dependent methyltransferase
MNVFGNYSRWYNLLYHDKDYAGEAKFISGLIKKYRPDARSILELGCGTGAHAEKMAKEGYNIHGVDISSEMFEQAQLRLAKMPAELVARVSFFQGDIRQIRLEKKYDVVMSLFHVMSYQTSNDDIMACFATAKFHLKRGGLFIFDFWYGPAVLTDPPVVRIKRLEDDGVKVVRIAEPVMNPNENVVDVNYTVFVRDKVSGGVDELEETHRMRYLFRPELDLLFAETGFERLAFFGWMTDCEPGYDTWYVCCVAKG